MPEVIAPEKTIQTIDVAFDVLKSPSAINAPTELARFSHAPVATTCLDIPSRELDLVDTGDNLILWGTLSPQAWLSRSDHAVSKGATEVTSVAIPDKRGGTMHLHTGRLPKAKRLQGTGVYVDFLYDETYRGYDGMFRIVVPKQADADLESQKQLLAAGFESAVGGAIYDPSKVLESGAAFREAMYREHNKIDGQLTPDQEGIISRLEITTTRAGRRRIVDYDRNLDDRMVGLRHEFKRSDNVIGMLVDGELLSASQRMITGSLQAGRSTGADILYGGSDSVYTYIQQGDCLERPTDKPIVLFKSEVLRRLDIRGYENDAYGSREREKPNELDIRFNRPSVKDIDYRGTASYERRVHPDDYADKLMWQHELCVETSVDVEDIDKIIVPGEQTDYFADTNWHAALAPYTEFTDMSVRTLRNVVVEEGVLAGIGFLTKHLGMPQEQAEYYLSGVGLTQMRDRLLKKLSILGVTEIAGRPVHDVITQAPVI